MARACILKATPVPLVICSWSTQIVLNANYSVRIWVREVVSYPTIKLKMAEIGSIKNYIY